MDEARRVLARLERIESLRAAGADPRALLAEMRVLLAEGEAWITAEGKAAGAAAGALDRLGWSLDREPPLRAE
jgi:hypothetical protein